MGVVWERKLSSIVYYDRTGVSRDWASHRKKDLQKGGSSESFQELHGAEEGADHDEMMCNRSDS